MPVLVNFEQSQLKPKGLPPDDKESYDLSAF